MTYDQLVKLLNDCESACIDYMNNNLSSADSVANRAQVMADAVCFNAQYINLKNQEVA